MNDSGSGWNQIFAAKYLEGNQDLSGERCLPRGSAIWNAILDILPILKSGLHWKIGDGNKVRFWDDNWLTDKPLKEDPDIRSTILQAKGTYGERVADYIEGTELNKKWKTLVFPDTTEAEKLKISEIQEKIKTFHIPIFPKEDKLIWRHSKTGQYTVKSGYETGLKNRVKDPISMKIWKMEAPPKVIMFTWLCGKGKILTQDNLKKRGFQLVNRCPLCRKSEESIPHLFLACEYATKVWSALFQHLKMCWVQPETVHDLICHWTLPAKCDISATFWKAILPFILWSIWKERNRRIFQNEARDTWTLANQVKAAIKEWTTRKETEFGKERSDDREGTVWEPPREGWIKLNFDGAAKGNPGKAGGGRIFRNHLGTALAAYAEFFGETTSHQAEMRAMWTGVQLARSKNWSKIIIEGDSLNIIKLIKGESIPHWSHEGIIHDATQTLAEIQDVMIRHTYREGNKAADLLANWGTIQESKQIWSGDLPDWVMKASAQDWQDHINKQARL